MVGGGVARRVKGRELPEGLKQFWLQQRQIAYWIFHSKSTVSLLNRIALWWDQLFTLYFTEQSIEFLFLEFGNITLKQISKHSVTATKTDPPWHSKYLIYQLDCIGEPKKVTVFTKHIICWYLLMLQFRIVVNLAETRCYYRVITHATESRIYH